MTSDILFTPDGKRYEKVVSAPAPTLERIQLSQQDLDDVEHVQPFVLTSDELPKYDVTYVGRESLDELGTYVFDVKPKKIEKNQRYFQGRIWVDDRDLNIVKTDGKAVPDIIKHGQENVFPRFETFRENIEGHYWFPTYTRSDDELHFSTGAVHIRMTIKYANYKRFGATIKIGPAVETKDEQQTNRRTERDSTHCFYKLSRKYFVTRFHKHHARLRIGRAMPTPRQRDHFRHISRSRSAH